MKVRISRLLRSSFAVLLCLSMLLTMAQAIGPERISDSVHSDGTTFGSISNITTAEWRNDALSESECKALLNAQTLHPQPTGWKELDSLISELLAPYTGQDTYTQLSAMYDWLVKNVTYSWNGYSKQTAPAYEYFTQIDCLKSMTYTSCMKKSVPDDMANRTMHILSAKEGVCYDYAIAFAVICRYIGIEAYVRTGYFSFETISGTGHHGWSVLMLDGKEYIFDPQRDARNWQYNSLNRYYFGITQENATRYLPDYAAADRAANPARDASMLAMTADREIASAHVWDTVTKDATCTEEGTITSTCRLCGKVKTETTAMLQHAWDTGIMTTPMTNEQDGIATFTCKNCGGTCTLTIPAGGSPFIDVQDCEKYYYEPVIWANENDIVHGIDASHFAPDDSCTRAQLVMFLYQAAGTPQVSAENPFADVQEGDYYYDAVRWAAENGIVRGVDSTHFAPLNICTRAQVVTILYRAAGEPEVNNDNPFTDAAEGSWYYNAVLWGSQTGIVFGMEATRFSPNVTCTRGQTVTFLWRYLGK